MKQLVFALHHAAMVIAASSDVDSKAVSSVSTASSSSHITTQKTYLTNTDCTPDCKEEGSVKLIPQVPYQVTIKVGKTIKILDVKFLF